MKLTFIDYLIFIWFGLLIIALIVETIYWKINVWLCPIYLIGWGALMLIKTFVKKKIKI